MRIKLHHVNLCTKDVAAMDAFYRGVLGSRPEPSLDENRVTGEGYAGKVLGRGYRPTPTIACIRWKPSS